MTDAALDDDPPEWLEPEDLTDDELQIAVPLPAEIVAAWSAWGRKSRERWRYLPDDPLPSAVRVGPTTVGTVVRALRWRSGHSQRSLATAAGLSVGVVERLEAAARSDPRLTTVVALLGVAGLRLAVVDDEGTQLAVPFDQDGRCDGGDRHLPAHRPQRPGHQRPTGVGPHPFTPVDRLP